MVQWVNRGELSKGMRVNGNEQGLKVPTGRGHHSRSMLTRRSFPADEQEARTMFAMQGR